MKLIVGLGNPGTKYEKTRHNTGYILVDGLSKKLDLKFSESDKFEGLVAKNDSIILLKPTAFMNKSGNSVSKVINFYKIPLSNIAVVHDDVDLEFGDVKSKVGASSAGHKGVQDIFNSLGTKEFQRIRVGVGRPDKEGHSVDGFVLMNFSNEELETISSLDLREHL
jgi:peptidyl-tRNA hydrolase, PTH1 family